MKGLKKVALASAVAAISAGAQAELKALDEATMGEMTGQAGLTIDVETKWTIGEFVYQDAGNVVLQGLSMGGNTNDAQNTGFLDNFRMTIDVAGAATENFAYGFSEVIGLSAVHLNATNPDADSKFTNAAAALLTSGATQSTADIGYGSARIDTGTAELNAGLGLRSGRDRTIGNGDLVIHFGFTDAWEKGGGFGAFATSNGMTRADADAVANGTGTAPAPGTGLSLASVTFDQAVDIATAAVDFQFDIDLIGIASEGYVIGSQAVEKAYNVTEVVGGDDIVAEAAGVTDTTADTTSLISNLSFKGYLGPADLHIQNNGNGFDAAGVANSKIFWDSYAKVTDLDLMIDIAGVYLGDIRIMNERGDITGLDGTQAFGFAHTKREIYAMRNNVLHLESLATTGNAYEDGIALNTEFKGDIDIGQISFGDTNRSIGKLFITDMQSDTNWTISAH